MRVLHLAAGNRWTGAAAPAFAEVESLRAAGIDAHYAYVGGYRLEAKIGHLDFTHPVIARAQNPKTFRTSVAAIRRLIDEYGFDVIHAHLTYDHWLGWFAIRRRKAILARTFHARRTLRSDPLTRSLLHRTSSVFVINDTFRDAPLLRGRNPLFTPPPVDHRQFTPHGADVRAAYGFEPDARVVAVIGKLSAGRGFELALETFAAIVPALPAARLMIIGHGEHRPVLEAHARGLGISEKVTWAGYHEEDLAEHYRAADLLLFTERGSDEGHRAILEAMACGVPPVTAPIDGVHALLPGLEDRSIASDRAAGSLAGKALAILREPRHTFRAAVAGLSQNSAYAVAAKRLIEGYGISARRA